MIDRRSLLRGLMAAPAVIAAGSLMPIRSIERLLMPTLWGDGIHDDTDALQAALSGKPFRNMRPDNCWIENLPTGTKLVMKRGLYLLNKTATITPRMDGAFTMNQNCFDLRKGADFDFLNGKSAYGEVTENIFMNCTPPPSCQSPVDYYDWNSGIFPQH